MEGRPSEMFLRFNTFPYPALYVISEKKGLAKTPKRCRIHLQGFDVRLYENGAHCHDNVNDFLI